MPEARDPGGPGAANGRIGFAWRVLDEFATPTAYRGGMARPSLYLTLLRRNLAEGHSWLEASERALTGVAQAYDLVRQSVLGPPALPEGSPDRRDGATAA